MTIIYVNKLVAIASTLSGIFCPLRVVKRIKFTYVGDSWRLLGFEPEEIDFTRLVSRRPLCHAQLLPFLFMYSYVHSCLPRVSHSLLYVSTCDSQSQRVGGKGEGGGGGERHA